jgi:3-deoxy-D-manno-octulosonate 8-phosphate phosphatase (KDO 8-P phosphatase)
MSDQPTFSPELLERASRIKLLLMDCDGVLSNGHIYFLPGPNGSLFETKSFDSQDGIALQWAHRVGIETGIISGRTSPAVEERARSAKMRYLYQGDTRKMPLLEEILKDSGLPSEEVGYIGDDLTDVPIMQAVGLAAAPSNSRSETLAAAHYVTPSHGGSGCVRDVMELLLKAQNRWAEILALYGIE